MDAGDLKAIAEKIAKWADAHSFVHHITLFGSLIRGEESFSDLDVFLEVSDWRKLSEHDRQDWKQQCFMTDYDSLRSQFERSNKSDGALSQIPWNGHCALQAPCSILRRSSGFEKTASTITVR
jgi:hypothetical protein